MFLCGAPPFVEFCKGFLHLVGQEIGQKAQPSGVHTDDGHARCTDMAGGLQQRTIATHRDSVVNVEVKSLELPESTPQLPIGWRFVAMHLR